MHIPNLDVSQSRFLKELLRETFSPLFCHAFEAENVTWNIQNIVLRYETNLYVSFLRFPYNWNTIFYI